VCIFVYVYVCMHACMCLYVYVCYSLHSPWWHRRLWRWRVGVACMCHQVIPWRNASACSHVLQGNKGVTHNTHTHTYTGVSNVGPCQQGHDGPAALTNAQMVHGKVAIVHASVAKFWANVPHTNAWQGQVVLQAPDLDLKCTRI